MTNGVTRNSEIDPNSSATGGGDNTPNCKGESPATTDGDNTPNCKGESPATTDGDSIANSELDCVSVRSEGSHTAHRSMLNRVDAVELGLKSAAGNQEGAQNSVSEGDGNAQTLSLQAPQLKEMEPSATEEGPLNASAEQVQTELEVPKIDKQMKKLEQENRRVRRILKNLTEERGEQVDEEFEPPSMQDAVSQKNYMRRVKRQTRKMQDIITSLRAIKH
ncbi:uncharacterized protein LOC117282081 [Cryptotermes secundus]|uniref:uncharacterized protein LOC117282081 n=1 Tax=Cryptotermes secundus TaxID=105785 RepID=UPI001454CF3A|nr:uncharacterized protein LOC117282081 [Cryptotermes secundus]